MQKDMQKSDFSLHSKEKRVEGGVADLMGGAGLSLGENQVILGVGVDAGEAQDNTVDTLMQSVTARTQTSPSARTTTMVFMSQRFRRLPTFLVDCVSMDPYAPHL